MASTSGVLVDDNVVEVLRKAQLDDFVNKFVFLFNVRRFDHFSKVRDKDMQDIGMQQQQIKELREQILKMSREMWNRSDPKQVYVAADQSTPVQSSIDEKTLIPYDEPTTSQESDQNPRQSRKRPLSSTDQKDLRESATCKKMSTGVAGYLIVPATKSAPRSFRIIKKIVPPATPPHPASYEVNGFCYVRSGQILQGRYKIEELLGTGAFSSVHKAEHQTTKNTVAVKIIRSEKQYDDSLDKEIGFMKRFGQAVGSESDSGSGRGSGPDFHIGSNNVIRLLDNFQIKGSNGIHAVLVFEMLGPDLFSVLFKSNHKILNLQRIQRFSKDILNGLDFLHSRCKIMHLDLKPENLLVTIDPKNMDLADRNCSASLKIGDFGISADSSNKDVCWTVQSCPYRAPEAHLKAEITPSTDIWSFGCTLYEMVTREQLFPCNGRDNCDKKRHLERISKLLGPIERKCFERDEKDKEKFEEVFGEKKVFNRDPAVKNKISFEEIRMKNAYVYAQAQALSEFLKKILKTDPKERPSAGDALKDLFLSDF